MLKRTLRQLITHRMEAVVEEVRLACRVAPSTPDPGAYIDQRLDDMVRRHTVFLLDELASWQGQVAADVQREAQQGQLEGLG